MVENSFGILVRRFRVLLTPIEQRPKVVIDIVLTCVVLHNMLRSHQGELDRPSTPADDTQPPQNDQGEQGQNEKSIEAGQTSTTPESYFIFILGHWLGRRTEIKKTRGRTFLSSISPFQNYPNNPRTCIKKNVTQKLIPIFNQFDSNSI